MKKYKFSPLQTAWLTALKSGKFKQATKQLGISDSAKGKASYCCLGLGCVIYNKLAEKDNKVKKTVRDSGKIFFDDESACLPYLVQRALRLRSQNGGLEKDCGPGMGCLAEMNDKGKTHKEIAAYIEQNPDKVFKP